MGAESLLHRVLKESEQMSTVEARVARFVSTHPNKVLRMSMAKLSKETRASDPTIMRFCRHFGFQGFQDFKLHLAQSLVPSAPFNYEPLVVGDSVENIVRKTGWNSLNAIQRGLEDIDPERIEAGARLLRDAIWTGIYASGISEVTAFDAGHKFQRLGLRCAVLMGRETQVMHAAATRPKELALIFSQSGHTRQMVELAKAIHAGGGHVLAVTADNSPLAHVSDALIAVTPYSRTELLTPIASRLNHHLVVNMLVTTIAMISGAEFPDQLTAIDDWQTEKI